MQQSSTVARFERRAEPSAESPTLIAGMPENGVVGSIAVNQITEQLGLELTGNIVSESFPPVSTFGAGRVRDLVRVYAGADPPIVIPHCDIALPPSASDDLAACVLDDVAEEFERAIVIVGVPAQSEEQIGDVTCVVSTDEAAAEVADAGIPQESSLGFIGGTSGAIVNSCYHADVPTIALLVKAHPFLPDPTAARAVIEKAVEPLVDFDIDTRPLQEEAEDIRRRMEQIVQHYEQLQTAGEHPATEESSMYQ